MKIINASATRLTVDGIGVVEAGEIVEAPEALGTALCKTKTWREAKTTKTGAKASKTPSKGTPA